MEEKTHALLIIDVQEDFFSENGVYKPFHLNRDIIKCINNWTEYSNRNNHLIVYVSAEYCKLKEFNESLDVIEGDNVVHIQKNFFNAFKETNLDQILKSYGINNLIITGVTTNTCVYHTSIAASELGYLIYVPEGATTSINHECYQKAYNNIINKCNLMPLLNNVIPMEINIDDLIKGTLWKPLYHKGEEVSRKACTQVIKSGNWEPVYRFPSDDEYFSDIFSGLSEKMFMYMIELFPGINHAKIQLYDKPSSNIGKHSDKTLDIRRDTYIINLSLGSTRTMCIKYKDRREDPLLFELKNNSVFLLDPKMNRECTHEVYKNPNQNSNNYLPRISIVYRNIATFRNKVTLDFRGQGAGPNGELLNENFIDDSAGLKDAFLVENIETDFNWDLTYGCGFYAVHT